MVTFNEGNDDRTYAERVLEGLRSIEGIQYANKKEQGKNNIIIEWQNHDPDSKFESAMSIVDVMGAGQYLSEMTMRFGPVAT